MRDAEVGQVWGVFRDELDVTYIVSYRIAEG